MAIKQKTSVLLTTTELSTGKKLQKTFTDINPETTNDKLVAFTRALNSLTTNTYIETNRVDKVRCDDEE